MSIKRSRLDYEDQFTQIPNTWMRDQRLSRRARGLLAEITTHRTGWRITIASLQEGGPEGREAIRAGVQELIGAGYLVRIQTRAKSGRMQEIDYELRDPFAAVGKPDTGPDQDIHSAEDDLSTHVSTGTTAVGFPDVGSADDGSADDGSPTPKEEHLSEDHLQKGGARASAPHPTCERHPKGTMRRCRACGDARRLWDAARTQPADPPPAAPPRPKYDLDRYCPHLELRTRHCEACADETRSAHRATSHLEAVPA